MCGHENLYEQCAINAEREDQSSLKWCRELEEETWVDVVAEGGCRRVRRLKKGMSRVWGGADGV